MDRLAWTIEKTFLSLPESLYNEWEYYITEHKDSHSLATLCAGSECPMTVKAAFKRAVFNVFNIKISWGHNLRVDHSDKKINFIKDMSIGTSSEKTPLIKKMEDLGSDEAVNEISGELIEIPQSTISWCGHPCTDVSRKNPNAKNSANRTTVRDKSMRTGGAFGGLLLYYTLKSPVQLGFCEQVEGYNDPAPPLEEGDDPMFANATNLDITIHELSMAGYWTMVLKVNPSVVFNFKTSRTRFWMPHVQESILRNLPIDDRHELVRDVFGHFADSAEPMSINEHLLDDWHPIVKAQYDQEADGNVYSPSVLLARSRKRKLAQANKAHWAEQNSEMCEQQGLNWMEQRGPSLDAMELFPGLQKLNPKQLDELASLGVEFPEKHCRTIDLSQSISRLKLVDGFGCQSPQMIQYLTDRCRTTLGVEAMQLQNIHYGNNHYKLLEHNNTTVQDLAGNAFEAYSCAASLLCGLSLLVKAFAIENNFTGPTPLSQASTLSRESVGVECDDIWS